MEQEPRNENWNNWENGGQQLHRPVIIVGEQDPSVHKKNSNLSSISLVLGILSLVLFWVPWITFILGVIGLITGIVSLVQHRDGHGAAVAGVITSSIGILVALVIGFLYILAIAMAV